MRRRIEAVDDELAGVEVVTVVQRRNGHLGPVVVGDVVDRRRLNDITLCDASVLKLEVGDRCDGLRDPFQGELGLLIPIRR